MKSEKEIRCALFLTTARQRLMLLEGKIKEALFLQATIEAMAWLLGDEKINDIEKTSDSFESVVLASIGIPNPEAEGLDELCAEYGITVSELTEFSNKLETKQPCTCGG